MELAEPGPKVERRVRGGCGSHEGKGRHPCGGRQDCSVSTAQSTRKTGEG